MPGNHNGNHADSNSGNHLPFGEDAIVIDPAVPETARVVLMQKFTVSQRPGRLSAAATPQRRGALIPFRDVTPRTTPPPQPPWVTSAEARRAWRSSVGVAVFFGGALIAAAAGSIPALIVMLVLTTVLTVFGVRTAFGARAIGWTQEITDPKAVLAADYERWYERQGPAYYHRRYVVPATDIDPEHMPAWARAIAAATSIRQSYVVQSRLVDFEQVTAALPQRLWDIAEGFARLSEVRSRQQESVRRAGDDDLYIKAKVAGQEEKLELAGERITARVKELEDFAALICKADDAKQRELALERLGEVDDLLLELLASTEEQPGDTGQAERLRLDAEAIIEQAIAAAQRFALPESVPEADAVPPGTPADAAPPDAGESGQK